MLRTKVRDFFRGAIDRKKERLDGGAILGEAISPRRNTGHFLDAWSTPRRP
jgi:hypothetical protein